MKRLLTWLRSPVVAVGSVLAVAAYSVLGTVVPQESFDPAGAARWAQARSSIAPALRALGLFAAFSSPAFIVLVALLTASLAACSWSRTRVALRTMRDPGMPPSQKSMRATHDIEVVSAGDAADAQEAATGALAAAGYRIRSHPSGFIAYRTLWAAVGSAVFHWSMVALILSIAFGQFVRSEGGIPVPIDGQAPYAPESMVMLERGPLNVWPKGVVFSARNLQLSTVRGGIDRGVSALVTVRDGAGRIVTRRVYPNSPLRIGSLLVHPNTWGYAPVLSIEATDNSVLATTSVRIDQSTATSAGAGPGSFDISGGPLAGAVVGVTIPAESVSADGRPVFARAVEVTIGRSGEASSAPVRIAETERVAIGGGLWLRFSSRGHFVGLSVADDPSVALIYAFFGFAALGMSVAVLFTPKRVWVAPSSDDPALLYVRVRGRRKEPLLTERVADELRRTLPEGYEVKREDTHS